MRFAIGTPAHARPVHHARRAGDRRPASQGPAASRHLRPGLDVRQELLPAARLPRRPGRPHHRLHGRVLHVPQILQSENHELMRILHLDAGKEMRGGQWQALRLIEGLAAAGVESTLLARQEAPLYSEARKGGWQVEPLGLMRAVKLARRHDLMHAHDARTHTLGAIVRGAPLVVARRVAFPIGAGRLGSKWKYPRARHYIAVSEDVKR